MQRRFVSSLWQSLEIVSVFLTIAVGVTLLWRLWAGPLSKVVPEKGSTTGAVQNLPKEPIAISGARIKGDSKASTVLVIFSDFQCPFCAKFASGAWPDIDREYVQTGKVLVAFRYLPLAIHARAMAAAEAAECAGQQTKFWEMHDLLFADPTKLDDASLRARATALGLDRASFEKCLSTSAAEQVNDSVGQAAALKIGGTPTFLIGKHQGDGRVLIGQRLSGAKPFDAFKAALDAAIASKESGG